MDKRLIFLTALVGENGVQTAEALAGKLKVGTRTVRSLIKEWNDCFSGSQARIQSKYGAGYFLQVGDRDAFERRKREIAAQLQEVGRIPCDLKERTEYLLNDLLNRRDYVTMEALSEILYISRKTISADLKEVERVLTDFGLKLMKRPNYGIRVEGTEFNRRLCIANVILGNEMREGALTDAGHREELSQIAQCVSKAIEEEARTALWR